MTAPLSASPAHGVDGATDRPGFRHEALLYASASELAAVAAPFLLQGLAAGDAAVLAVGPQAVGALRDALNDDPRVLILDRDALYRARTPAAITAFRRLAAEQDVPGRRIRVVGEVDFGPTDADQREWQAYEAVINHALAPLPRSGLCVFDTTRLPDPVLAAARHTHPHLRTAAGGPAPNPAFVTPERYLRALPVPAEPLEDTAAALAIDDVSDLAGLRHALRTLLTAVTGPGELIEDYLLAVDEIVSNAVRHGHPPVRLQLWTAPTRLVCTISDTGRDWDNPFAGYGPAHGGDLSHGGMGLWLARQLCDHVVIRHTADGAAVRLTSGWN